MRQVNEAPQKQAAKGQACTMAFRVLICFPWKASMKRGGKSSVGRNSRAEQTKASSLIRCIPAMSKKSLGGVGTLILTLLQK